MRRLLVPICLGVILALGVPSVQAGNQEEANRIAQSLTQQYPQYNIQVAYQEGKVRIKGEVASEADRDAVANFVRHIPKVRSVSENLTVSSSAAVAPVANNNIMPVQALTPASSNEPVLYSSDPIPYNQEALPYDSGAPIGTPIASTPAPAAAPAAPIASATIPTGTRSPSDYFAPQGAYTPAPQNGQPNLPNYAWPSYASYPNYSQVAYPKNYAASAFPYIGPFYPYPEVPMGWRKVSMQWHDGYWWLDFNDGSKNGPFSPLFRQPQRYR